MDELTDWCREGLVAGLHALEESSRALRGGDPEGEESARRLARLLHGTATAYGFGDVARTTREVLDRPAPVTAEAVDAVLEALRQLTVARDGAARPDILVVEDDPVTGRVLQAALEETGRRVTVARSGAEARASLARHRPDLLVLDLGLPDMDGRALLLALREEHRGHEVPVIVLTGKEVKLARAECLALGADEYLEKPVDPGSLQVVAAAHLQRGTRREPARLDGAGVRQEAAHGLAGTSRAMHEVYRKLELAAPTEVTILLTGESGTGKEMAARALHRLSRRHDRPFVAVNCSALPETLLESELFGHVKGAFTDAFRDKVGVFQSADGGTLFLDEIGDLSPLLQLKLLRVIQEREVRRVGDERPFRVDVRLLTATNRDLKALLASRAIRDDFYYRIRVFEIRMPALRDRPGDLPLLTRALLEESDEARRKHVTGVSREALAALEEYGWPGNVRELRNAIEHALVTVRGATIEFADLPEEVRARGARHANGAGGRGSEESERARIVAALAETKGHKAKAAALLGISRITLWKRLRHFGLQHAEADPDPEG